MSAFQDWWVWLLAIGVILLFGWYFWRTAGTIIQSIRQVGATIENWPLIRRAQIEAEIRTPGGRYPLWFRAIRVLLIAVLIVGAAWLVLHRLFGVI